MSLLDQIWETLRTRALRDLPPPPPPPPAFSPGRKDRDRREQERYEKKLMDVRLRIARLADEDVLLLRRGGYKRGL